MSVSVVCAGGVHVELFDYMRTDTDKQHQTHLHQHHHSHATTHCQAEGHVECVLCSGYQPFAQIITYQAGCVVGVFFLLGRGCWNYCGGCREHKRMCLALDSQHTHNHNNSYPHYFLLPDSCYLQCLKYIL